MIKYKLTFLGTGTSQGIPVIGCRCPVCLSEDRKDKRLRTSVHIQSHHTSLVIDTGPDFRFQCLKNHIHVLDAVVFTHEHMDHMAGLDDIRPFNFFYDKKISIYAEPRVLSSIQRIFSYVFDDTKYPGIPEMELHPINDRDTFAVGDIPFLPLRVMHKDLPVLGFRVADLVYITDANYISDEVIEKIKNCKIFVINALRHAKHVSHFNLNEALEIIQKVNPYRAYLTHISHQLGRYDEICSLLPENVLPAHDGLELVF